MAKDDKKYSSPLIYMGTIEYSFVLPNKKEIKLHTEAISSMQIIHDYVNNIMPIIYVHTSVRAHDFNTIDKYKNDGLIKLKISYFDTVPKSKIVKTMYSGEFVVLYSTEARASTNSVDQIGITTDITWVKITFGLIPKSIVDYNRKIFSGRLLNVSTNTIISNILGTRSLAISKITKPISHKQYVYPPSKFRAHALEHFFLYKPFFDTIYNYYMDFNKSYLYDLSGEPLKLNNQKPKTDSIVIDVQPSIITFGSTSGMYKDLKDKTYVIFINEAQCKDITDNTLTNKFIKKKFLSTDNVPSTALPVINNTNKLPKTTLVITKQGLFSDVISPERKILVRHFKKSLSGTYIITQKKEILTHNSELVFNVSTELTLRKVK